jgi:hypothetical protein
LAQLPVDMAWFCGRALGKVFPFAQFSSRPGETFYFGSSVPFRAQPRQFQCAGTQRESLPSGSPVALLPS